VNFQSLTLINFTFFGIKVQGKDRLYVKYVAEQLGLDGSYVPRTYIEQIQLEKLVNDVMV
jgi:uridine kinase